MIYTKLTQIMNKEKSKNNKIDVFLMSTPDLRELIGSLKYTKLVIGFRLFKERPQWFLLIGNYLIGHASGIPEGICVVFESKKCKDIPSKKELKYAEWGYDNE